MERELSGKAALVTGSSGGIGKHIALALARAGADVAVTYRTNRAGAEAVAAGIRELGVRAVVLGGDATRPEDCRRWVAETVAAFGRLDILVNNVGEFAYKLTREHTDEEFERIIAGTIGTTFYCTMAALPHMKARGWGRVVNIGAAGAERAAGRRKIGPHLAGKSAVVSLTRTLAMEEAEHGITFNAVLPGVIEDRELSREEAWRRPDRYAPIGHPGTSQDVADAVLFLVSPRSWFVNGAAIAVTGGWEV